MYYLSDFCRICIKTGGRLRDINSIDFDEVKLSEKLKVCTKMVISKESLSSLICTSCIQKLQISYQFQDMCKQSSTILQGYLTELLSTSQKLTADTFVNSQLHVTLTKLPTQKRKRIGKEQRCSLLKKFLTTVKKDKVAHNSHINGLKDLCDRYLPLSYIFQQPRDASKGGLKDLISYTKNFDFGFDISQIYDKNKNYDVSPLEKLEKFSEIFFYDEFEEFRNIVLNIRDDSSDNGDDMFDKCEENMNKLSKFEEVFVEPDIKIKKEIEPEYEENYDFTSSLVQVCYGDNNEVKEECNTDIKINFDEVSCMEYNNRPELIPVSPNAAVNQKNTFLFRNVHLEKINMISDRLKVNSCCNNQIPSCLSKKILTPSRVGLIEHISFLSLTNQSPKNIAHTSLKCRTRGNPFINPHLRKQFQTQCFKCTTCNRRFKSPGYLKSHCSKLRH